MDFTVTYRGADGAMHEECMEAADRAECIAECKRRRIAPIKVEEGKRRKKASPFNSMASLKRSYGLIAGTIVIATSFLVCVWWWMHCREPKRNVRNARLEAKIEKIQNDRLPAVTNVLPIKVSAPETNAVAQSSAPKRLERGVEVVSESVRTNQSGAVIEKLTLADGRMIEKVHPPKPVFSNPSDQMISLVLSFKPGQTMAPLPSLTAIDDDFARSLLEPIEIKDDDSDEVKELKLAVKETRAYLATEVKNGRSVRECLNEHRERMEEIADRHQMAVEQMQKLKAEGVSAEEIQLFKQRVNEVFRAKDIPELP